MKKGWIQVFSAIGLILALAILVYEASDTNLDTEMTLVDTNRKDGEFLLREEASAPVLAKAWESFRSTVNPFFRETLAFPIGRLWWENIGSNPKPFITDSIDEALIDETL